MFMVRSELIRTIVVSRAQDSPLPFVYLPFIQVFLQTSFTTFDLHYNHASSEDSRVRSSRGLQRPQTPEARRYEQCLSYVSWALER